MKIFSNILFLLVVIMFSGKLSLSVNLELADLNFHLYSLNKGIKVPKVNLKLQDKYEGAILGAAIGDALGRVTEFLSTTQQIKSNYLPEGIKSFTDFKQNDFIDGKAIYTDDTIMAKILLESFMDDKDKSNDEIISNLAKKYAALFGPDKLKIDPLYNYRAHGPTNINAGKRLWDIIMSGSLNNLGWWILPAKKSNISKEGGCGSVMRAWPIGLVFNDISKIKELADKQSRITHRHPMSIASSVAMAIGVYYAKIGESLDNIINNMFLAAQEYDNQELGYKNNAKKYTQEELNIFDPKKISQDKLLTSDMIKYAYNMAKLGKTPEEILGVNNIKQTNFRSPDGYLLGWAADESVAGAVYVFARHANVLQSGLQEAVNTPGDSDSIATLAGALIGSYSGISSLDKANFDYSKLENLDKLKELAIKASSL